jgi:hypothetical protein
MKSMKRKILFITTSLILVFSSCSKTRNIEDCSEEGVIGNEYFTVNYFNEGTPTVSDPFSINGNISFDTPFAENVSNGVDVVIPGIRVRSQTNNFNITRVNIEERGNNEPCFFVQNEFNLSDSSFDTDIASVLVLDMSTSLLGNITQLKEYAKDYANTVVNSSDGSTVAVVFFSDRDAIQSTAFYTSSNIGQLNTIIDNFSNFQERTALYQAVQTGINLLESLPFTGEKSIVAFTDGGDNDSNNPSQLIAEINASDVEKFAIGLRGGDFQESGLREIVSQTSNFVVADNINDLENIFATVSRGVISVWQVRYSRSDQLLSSDETVQIRFSFETEIIE